MRKSFKLENLDCANCAAKMEAGINELPGVNKASISFMTSKLMIDADAADEEALAAIVDAAQAVNVIDKAKVPAQPSGPNRKLYIAVAALAGLFVAVAIVVLLDMLNTRVRSVDDAVELLGVPVIGRFPVVKGGK